MGSTGATGPVGGTGTNGVSGYEQVSSTDDTATATKEMSVSCPPGKYVVGGGFISTNQTVDVKLNAPTSYTTWSATVHKGASGAWGLTVTRNLRQRALMPHTDSAVIM